MSGDEKHKKDAEEELARLAESLMGDMAETDEYEVEELYQEFSQGKDPAMTIRELASKAAQKHRLANRPAPVHVQSALDATRQGDLNSMKPSVLKTIIDQVLRPTRSAVHSAAPAYRNRKDVTARDIEIVEELSSELEEPWKEGNSE
jgi:hypothetical protein